jgi:hypothetical protein
MQAFIDGDGFPTMPEAAPNAVTEPLPRCYRCDAPLAGSAPDVCTECGRAQTRVCFCGARISRAVKLCPECGTDWSHIRRSRRQSSTRRRSEALRSALGGGLLALLAAGILYGCWRLIAAGHASDGAQAAGSALASFGGFALRALQLAWAPLLVFAVGTVGGLLVYRLRGRQRRSRRLRKPAPPASTSE